MKALGSTGKVHSKPRSLSVGGDSGIANVEVKFVDISRNTGGEGGYLDDN